VTSPHSFSITKFIQTVEIQFKNKPYTLVDTPGFEDTQGVEVDISNGIGVIQAVKQAK